MLVTKRKTKHQISVKDDGMLKTWNDNSIFDLRAGCGQQRCADETSLNGVFTFSGCDPETSQT